MQIIINLFCLWTANDLVTICMCFAVFCCRFSFCFCVFACAGNEENCRKFDLQHPGKWEEKKLLQQNFHVTHRVWKDLTIVMTDYSLFNNARRTWCSVQKQMMAIMIMMMPRWTSESCKFDNHKIVLNLMRFS